MTLSFLADVNISPLTISHLRDAGYTIQRTTDLLSANASDNDIVALGLPPILWTQS